ncbi:MAG: AMP-binding protein [Candidatus Lactobacillus pullistercoris]|uniref:AMP-binding protein n=1 Tax=Candidatus Lactobacillus pullistercoris TaxID=2838636 RepID=A0A9E2KS50_9LACO|nr:AMP-binding protein [Candidatus Lactobacillus pullistercoris]
MSEENYPATIRQLWKNRINSTPDKVFLVENRNHYTYLDIDKRVDKKVEELRQFKVKPGDIIALQFELDLENFITILACIKLKTVINPLNPHLDIDEAKDLVNRFKPYLIIAQKAPRGRDTFYSVDNLTNYDLETTGDCKIFINHDHTKNFTEEFDSAESPIVILNTSGTTGAVKGVVLTNKNVLSAEYAYNKAFKITNEDMILMSSGLYHAIGFHHGLISTIMAGSSIAILRHYNVDKIAEIIKNEPVTFIDSVPTVIYDILFRIKDLGHLKQLLAGGDKLRDDLLRQADKRGIPVYNCYGSTEAVPFSYTPSDYFEEKNHMTTALKPMEGIEVRLVVHGQTITSSNVEGTIQVKGPEIFKEYLFNPEKTKSSFDGEWFDTGDYGHYNYDKMLEIDGRNSDKIIRGGENISAAEVEEKVRNCDNIKEVAVLGIPDVRLGQRIGAFISLKDKKQQLTKQKLIAELTKNKTDKKFWPERIWIVDSLPKTANGKIKKYILKQKVEG